MKVGENALAEFLDTRIVWEADIVAILRTNRAIKRLNACQQKEYDNATRATSAVTSSYRMTRRVPKFVITTISRAGLSALPIASVTWSAG